MNTPPPVVFDLNADDSSDEEDRVQQDPISYGSVRFLQGKAVPLHAWLASTWELQDELEVDVVGALVADTILACMAEVEESNDASERM